METTEMWREASGETYREMWQSVQWAGLEILEYNPEATDTAELWDSITEQADGLIPVNYGEQVREWYALGLPDLDGSGLSDGSIFSGITGVLFEWYHGELSRVVSEMLEKRVEMLGEVAQERARQFLEYLGKGGNK